MLIFQKGFNYNQDGKGNRLVYHMQGCNLRCPWCANPESMPINAYKNFDTCKNIADDVIVKECINSSPLYYDGGGVTFSGGEPTLQFDSLKYVLTKLTALSIDTAIETNGTHPNLPQIFPYINQLIIDCKHYDSKKHKQYTGVENENIIENIIQASKTHSNVLVRIPLINGYNADINDIDRFIKLLAPLNVKVELLKYHEYGKVKWVKCGKNYMVQNGYISDEIYKEFTTKMSKQIFLVNT